MGKRSLLSRLVALRRCAGTTGMNDIVKQVVPAGVVVVVVEHRQGVEETKSCGDAVASVSPKLADLIAHGMEAERDQVHG